MKIFETLSRRGLALFLVLTMCLSLLPATALADELEGGSELTGGDVQTDDAADLTTTDEATVENAGETTDAATSGETGDETGSGDAALNGNEAQDGSEKAEEKQESPEVEKTNEVKAENEATSFSLRAIDEQYMVFIQGGLPGNLPYNEVTVTIGGEKVDISDFGFGSVAFDPSGKDFVVIRNSDGSQISGVVTAAEFGYFIDLYDKSWSGGSEYDKDVMLENEDNVFLFLAAPKENTFMVSPTADAGLNWRYIAAGGKRNVDRGLLGNEENFVDQSNEEAVRAYVTTWPTELVPGDAKVDASDAITKDNPDATWTMNSATGEVEQFNFTINGKTYTQEEYGIRWVTIANANFGTFGGQTIYRYHVNGTLYKKVTVNDVLKGTDGKPVQKLVEAFPADFTEENQAFSFQLIKVDETGKQVDGFTPIALCAKVAKNSNAGVEIVVDKGDDGNTTLPFGYYAICENLTGKAAQTWNPDRSIYFGISTDGMIDWDFHGNNKNTTITNALKEYKVDFNLDGSTIPSREIKAGSKVTEDDAPTSSDGKVFDGWYTDPACTKKYDFNIPVYEDITLYGQWKETNSKYVIYVRYMEDDGNTQLKERQFGPSTAKIGSTIEYTDIKDKFEIESGWAIDEIKGLPLTVSAVECENYIFVYCAKDEMGADPSTRVPKDDSDGIPDKYQATVKFEVVHGAFTDAGKEWTRVYDLKKRDDVTSPWEDLHPTLSAVPTYSSTKTESDMWPDDTHTGNGAWNVDEAPSVDTTPVTGNKTYTYTFNTVGKYTVRVEYLDEAGEALRTAYTGEFAFGESYDVTSAEQARLTYGADHYVRIAEGTDPLTGSNPSNQPVVNLKQIYALDNLVEGQPSTTPGGDGIPDKYQAVVRYEAVNGIVSINDTVVTLYKDGNPAIDGVGHLAAGQIPTATANAGYNQDSESWNNGGKPTTATPITGNVTYTVTFTANPVPTHTLTINYVYEDGSEAAPTATRTVNEGAGYAVTSPVIDGYTADRTTVTGTMGTGDVTVTVTYRPVPPTEYDLVINYVYADGTTAAPSHTETIVSGGSFSVTSPVIGGFTADQIVVSGSMTGDRTITVIYTPAGGGGTPVTPVTPVTPNAPDTTIPDGPTPTGPSGVTIGDEDTPLAAPGLNSTDHFDYIKGYGDGTVRPEANIKRSEVATIFFRLMTNEFRTENWATENDFTDVKAGDWYNNAISTAAKAGILNGYEDGSFQPNRDITRAEFAAIAARFASDVVPSGGMFSDIEGHWAQESIERASAAGWIRGSDGKFRPNDKITRAEAITLINRMLDRVPDADHLLPDMITFSDNTPDKWYYADVQEATNSHDYERAEDGVTGIWTQLLPECDWTALEKEWATAASAPSTNLMGGQQGSEGEGEAKPEETTGGNGGSKPEETTGGEDETQDETTGSGEE